MVEPAAGATAPQQDPFPLLVLPDLVLGTILSHLTPRERKATRATCKKLCKVASAAGKSGAVANAVCVCELLANGTVHRLAASAVCLHALLCHASTLNRHNVLLLRSALLSHWRCEGGLILGLPQPA